MTGCGTTPAAPAHEEDGKLELVRVFPVESARPVEPSGLCLYQGVLYSVSDKSDGTVYRISFGNGVARMEPHIRFDPPAGAGVMDFEGITVDEEGNFYLASETHARILRVTPEGEAQWHFASVREAGRAVGLFKVPNAYAEGITILDNGNILLAAERQPRGLIEVDGRTGEVVRAQVMNQTRFSNRLSILRRPDWTGLYNYGGEVFALFRNANLVVRLERGEDGGFRETDDAWGFRHVEESGEFRFDDLRYGKAEGLAIDERYFYIILDNNRRPRAIDRSDRRPLLFVFRNPLHSAGETAPGAGQPLTADSR
ncbi:MAG: esterase-like activity of phytase family protein [Opitutales bacterium]|nr:esterase-like activity of phytase family protein [Opitutales bacterium]